MGRDAITGLKDASVDIRNRKYHCRLGRGSGLRLRVHEIHQRCNFKDRVPGINPD